MTIRTTFCSVMIDSGYTQAVRFHPTRSRYDAYRFFYRRTHSPQKTGEFVIHECPWRQQISKLAIFSIKVTVKVTRSLTLVSFERVSLVE